MECLKCQHTSRAMQDLFVVSERNGMVVPPEWLNESELLTYFVKPSSDRLDVTGTIFQNDRTMMERLVFLVCPYQAFVADYLHLNRSYTNNQCHQPALGSHSIGSAGSLVTTLGSVLSPSPASLPWIIRWLYRMDLWCRGMGRIKTQRLKSQQFMYKWYQDLMLFAPKGMERLRNGLWARKVDCQVLVEEFLEANAHTRLSMPLGARLVALLVFLGCSPRSRQQANNHFKRVSDVVAWLKGQHADVVANIEASLDDQWTCDCRELQQQNKSSKK